MIFIDRTQTDPYFNIAAEEYVLKNIKDDVFMLWVNSPSVIVGKHQVASAEADILYTHANAIPVIRRISGGGTVYHDEGNLNYSLISSGKKGKLVDYEKYAGTVIRALKKFNLQASLQRKSSLYVKDKKFSGNAEHVFHDRVLHHGTLLYDTSLDELRKCIRPSHNNYIDRSIKSVDSQITNLSEHLPPTMDINQFKEQLFIQAKEDFEAITEYHFMEEDIKQIEKLVANKYTTDEWNFAYSPKYQLRRKFSEGKSTIEVTMACEKGHISEISFSMNGNTLFPELTKKLITILHHPGPILEILVNDKELNDANIKSEELASALF